MVRFQNQKKSRKNRRVFLSICVFLVILLLFISGIDSFSDSTRRHQKESLERALNRSIIYCYATEGTYPESLEDLKAHYGLTYDEDLFFVDYQTVGAISHLPVFCFHGISPDSASAGHECLPYNH